MIVGTEEYKELRDKFFSELEDKLSKAEIGFKAYDKGYEQAKLDIIDLIDTIDLFTSDYRVQLLVAKINQLGRKGE